MFLNGSKWQFDLIDFFLMFESIDGEMKKIIFLDQFLQNIFSGVSKKGRRWVGIEDSVDDFDALTVVSDFLKPAQAYSDIVNSLALKYLYCEYLFDGLENQVDVVATDDSFILDLLEEEIESVVSVFTAVFAFFEERGEE